MGKMIHIMFVLCFLTLNLSSQEFLIPDNPYFKADKITVEKNSFNRERWFYEQRMYPNNKIPAGEYRKAIAQRNELRNRSGYFSDNASSWTPIGPQPGTYFQFGNISGRIVSVKYDPSNPAILYLGTANGGIWKTTNSGLSWNPLSDFEPSLASGSIAINPASPETVYCMTGEATYSSVSYFGHGLLKSTNGGGTWQNYNEGLPANTYCSKLVCKPGSSLILFAAMAASGLYKSLNGGVSWDLVYPGRCDDIVFSPTGDTAWAAGSGTGFIFSSNGGSTFNLISSIQPGGRNHIAICYNQPNVLYFVKYTGGVEVFKSTDGGMNFAQPPYAINEGQGWYNLHVRVNPVNPNLVYVGVINLWRSTNGGSSFSDISSGKIHFDQHGMDFNPVNPDEIAAVNDGGIWKSTDRGDNWINLNSNVNITQFYRLASDQWNQSHLLGGTQDNGTQRTINSSGWQGIFSGDGGDVCFGTLDNNYIIGETQNNGIFRSTNYGLNWDHSQSGLFGIPAWIGPIISHPFAYGVFYTARQNVFRSTNNGASWTAISPQMGLAGINEMAMSVSNPDVMYISLGPLLYRSSNGGYNFESTAINAADRIITSISVHPDSSGTVIITLSGTGTGRIYKTTDGGVNWESISSNLPDSPCNDCLIYYPGFSTSTYIAATDIGVFISTNWGTSWEELGTNLPNTVVMHLDFHRSSGLLRAATHGRGVWQTEIITGVISNNGEVPRGYSLGQNYPNPFNPMTFIKYQIPEQDNVKITVYDAIGKEIKTIVNSFHKPGTYVLQFNPGNISTGVYFYTMQTSEFFESRKMIIIR